MIARQRKHFKRACMILWQYNIPVSFICSKISSVFLPEQQVIIA
jgi:hypothetical protein